MFHVEFFKEHFVVGHYVKAQGNILVATVIGADQGSETSSFFVEIKSQTHGRLPSDATQKALAVDTNGVFGITCLGFNGAQAFGKSLDG